MLSKEERTVKRMISLALFVAGLAAHLSGAAIEFQVSSLGGGTFEYTYTISSFVPCTPSCAGDTLDLSFDGAVYNVLSNPVAQPVSDWSTTVFQPNALPGLAGDYLLTSNVANPSLAGPFSIDFTLQPGAQPGPQPFTIFDANFNTLGTGTTTPVITGVPEPASFSLMTAGMLLGVVVLFQRRRAKCVRECKLLISGC
jgi:hypothetical protein